MEQWELVARERIRDSIARYTWSGDSGRIDEMVMAFCADGTLEVRGQDPIEGRTAIASFMRGVADDTPPIDVPVRRIVRHNLTNTRFLEIRPDRAQVVTYFTVFTELGLDHLGRYRDTFVPVGDEWLIQHRFVSTDWRAAGSTMAPPESVT